MMAKDSDAKRIAGKILSYLQSKGKLNLISDISKNLLAYAENKKVNVYYAVTLTAGQKKKIISKFSKLTNTDDFNFIPDKSLLDGFVVKYEDRTWDLSLKSNLEKIMRL